MKTKAKQHMKCMFAKQQGGHDGSNLDLSEDEQWSSGINQAEQMHVLASPDTNPSKDDIEFTKNDLKRYKNQTKSYFKNKS